MYVLRRQTVVIHANLLTGNFRQQGCLCRPFHAEKVLNAIASRNPHLLAEHMLRWQMNAYMHLGVESIVRTLTRH